MHLDTGDGTIFENVDESDAQANLLKQNTPINSHIKARPAA
jgi:hypothetical protein